MPRQKVTVPSGPLHLQDGCHIYRLPAELRNTIFSLALAVKPDQKGQVAFQRQAAKSGSVLELLGTCRIIYQEASGLFYTENKLRIDFWLGRPPRNTSDIRILASISPLRMDGLRDLTVAYACYYRVLEDVASHFHHLQKLSALQTLELLIGYDAQPATEVSVFISLEKRDLDVLKATVRKMKSLKLLRFELGTVIKESSRAECKKALEEVVASLPSNETS